METSIRATPAHATLARPREHHVTLAARAMTLETLATDADRLGRPGVAELYVQRARDTRSQADLARRFLLDLVKPT